jgi:hypothetical protein
MIGLLAAWLGKAAAQVQDSLPGSTVSPVLLDTLPIADTILVQIDSSKVGSQLDTTLPGPAKKKFFVKRFFNDYPNPNKAVLLSLVVPGAGQFYNKRWWKTPIIYGGYYLFIRAVQKNTQNYRRFRDAYIAELAGEQHEFKGTRYNAGDLRRIRDGYDKNKQLSIIGIVGLHLIQTAEAFVDCHLKTFDVSDDLSFKVVPSFGNTAFGETTVGIGLRFQLSGP